MLARCRARCPEEVARRRGARPRPGRRTSRARRRPAVSVLGDGRISPSCGRPRRSGRWPWSASHGPARPRRDRVGDGRGDPDLDRRRGADGRDRRDPPGGRRAPTGRLGSDAAGRRRPRGDEHPRRRARTCAPGRSCCAPGRSLGAAELGAAVGAGVGRCRRRGRPRVAVLCTGDELRAPGEPLGPGEIHNSNAPMLIAAGRAQRRDRRARPTAARRPRRRPRRRSHAALERVRRRDRHRRRLGRPARPRQAGARRARRREERSGASRFSRASRLGSATRERHSSCSACPGNPVSAVVTFSLFARAGARGDARRRAPIGRSTRRPSLGDAVRRNPGREQALRVRLERRDGRTIAFPNGPQGSHIMTSLIGADALALIPAGDGRARGRRSRWRSSRSPANAELPRERRKRARIPAVIRLLSALAAVVGVRGRAPAPPAAAAGARGDRLAAPVDGRSRVTARCARSSRPS